MHEGHPLWDDVLRTRILAFLADHFEHCFTVEELSGEQSISGSVSDIQSRIDALLADGLVKERSVGGKYCVQAVKRQGL